MWLAFLGTPDFAVTVLRALVDAGHDVARVYAQPPARAGRGRALRLSAV
ncbi:MAG: methionyl-tRNA formyltransferase, partial [Pseudomonadota bacterium]